MMNNLKNRILRYYEKYMFILGILGNTTFFFQIHKIVANQSSADVSLIALWVAFGSLASWLFYGWLKQDWVLMGVNIFALIGATLCIGVTILYS